LFYSENNTIRWRQFFVFFVTTKPINQRTGLVAAIRTDRLAGQPRRGGPCHQSISHLGWTRRGSTPKPANFSSKHDASTLRIRFLERAKVAHCSKQCCLNSNQDNRAAEPSFLRPRLTPTQKTRMRFFCPSRYGPNCTAPFRKITLRSTVRCAGVLRVTSAVIWLMECSDAAPPT